MKMAFELNTAEFTGPIEVLLDLIERRKLPINDISLSMVTDEYLAFVTHIDNSSESIANRIHFVYVASTLALIKSKSLLPTLELTSEEEVDIEKLKERLLLYQQYQEIAQLLQKEILPKPKFYFPKEQKQEARFQPHESFQIPLFVQALETVFHEIPEVPQTKQEGYIKIAVHIEEVMNSLVERVKNMSSVSFNSFLKESGEKHKLPKEQKVYAVVSFLALLEVVRNHGLGVEQPELFSDITIGSY